MEVLYFGVWCRPFDQYWAVPTNSSKAGPYVCRFASLTNIEQCSAATNHLITNAVFNISSDLIIISIPMPLLFKVRLPKKNKAILVSVFLIGAFTYVWLMTSSCMQLTWYTVSSQLLLTSTILSQIHLARNGLSGISENRILLCFAPTFRSYIP
jgi:hypothetical protein